MSEQLADAPRLDPGPALPLTGIGRRRLGRLSLAGIGLLAALALWSRLVDAAGGEGELAVALQDLVTIALSIVVEALPFLTLGVLVSTFIHHFVSLEQLARVLPKRDAPRRMALSAAGILMPVCECGNVPVVRELIRKGLSPSDATTFLLAAPNANPITVASTWAAFGFAPWIPAVRLLGALAVANLVGWAIARRGDQERILAPPAAAGCAPHAHQPRSTARLLDTFRREYTLLLGVLCLGAIVASASQVLVPTAVLTTIGGNAALSVAAMMALAFVVSICASFDAFFALAYASTFTAGSLLAFMVFGPVINLKILVMLRTTYRARFLVALAAGLAVLVGAGAIGVDLIDGMLR